MNILRNPIRLASLIALTLLPAALPAQADAPLKVNRVKFNNNVNPFDWNNMEIELEAQRTPGTASEYVDDIEVTVTLAYEQDDAEGFLMFRSSVEIITLQVGDSRLITFWLPYDVVERYDLDNEPKYWIVDLSVAGQVLPVEISDKGERFSRNITTPQVLSSFRSRADAEASANDGVLRPQYLSPYPPQTREPAAYRRSEEQ